MHIPSFSKAFMEFKCFAKNMWSLAVAASCTCSFKVIHELISVGRMSDVVDDNLCSFLRGQTANISNTLFRNEYMGIMFGVVYMGAHRNYCGDLAALSSAVAEEAGQESITCEVTGAADTIHQFGTAYMGGVYVAVNIHFQCSVHSDNAETTSYFTVVRNFLRAENDLLVVFFNVCIETFQSIRGWGQGSTGNHVDLAFIDEVEHAVLDNFGVYRKVLEVGNYEAMDNCISNVAYTGLQWKQVFRKSAMFNFVFQEVNEVVAHSFCIVIEWSQCTGYVWQVAWNDSNDLGRITWNVWGTYAVANFGNRNRFAVRRILTHVDISHASEFNRLGGVNFYDNFLSCINEYRRVTNSGGRVEFTVRSDLAYFQYCKVWSGYAFTIYMGEEACADLLCNMGQMQVEIVDGTCIDCFSQISIGLVRHTVSNAVYCYQFSINLGTGGCTSPDIYLEWCFFHTFSEFMHCDFRIAAWSKSGNTKDIAWLNHCCCSLCITDFGFQVSTFNSAKEFAIIGVDHYYHPPKK